MELTIEEKKVNPSLKRMEISGKIVFEAATPSNFDVSADIAHKLNKDADLVVVKNIYTKFGHKEADFSALVYDTMEARQRTERLTKHMKKKIEESKKADEAKKAEESKKAEEAKAEPSKEEAAEKVEEAPKEDAAKEEKPTEEAPKEEESKEEKPVEEAKEAE